MKTTASRLPGSIQVVQAGNDAIPALSNSNLEIRSADTTNTFAIGLESAEGTFAGDLHDPSCDCNGRGYFLGDFAHYGRGHSGIVSFRAPPGRLFLNYCGLEDAASDDEILQAYGTQRDANYDIDKWGVMVVSPRAEHLHLAPT